MITYLWMRRPVRRKSVWCEFPYVWHHVVWLYVSSVWNDLSVLKIPSDNFFTVQYFSKQKIGFSGIRLSANVERTTKLVTINIHWSTLNIPRIVKIDWTINLLKVFLNWFKVLIRRFKLVVDNRLVCVSLSIQLGVNFRSFPIRRNLIETITMDYNLVFISRHFGRVKGVDTSMESSFERIFAVCFMLNIKINVVLDDSILKTLITSHQKTKSTIVFFRMSWLENRKISTARVNMVK